MSYFLCAAGVTLRSQVDDRWPRRDTASDGWIGDASHAAVASDHNPCWTCTGDSYGVVRAIDIDSDLDKDNKDAAQHLANQLIECARKGNDNDRLSYVIYNGRIASGTYSATYWLWRSYTGSDPHTSHIHVSFMSKGDQAGGKFPLDVFTAAARRERRQRKNRLRRAIDDLAVRFRSIRSRLEAKRDRLRRL